MVLIINKIKKNLEQSKYIARKDGVLTTCYCLFYEVINRITPFSVYKVMRLTMLTLNTKYLKCPKKYRCLFLEKHQIEKYSSSPSNDMSKEFVEEALRHEEECFAILDGEVLASYGWYSIMPTHARRELYFYFNKSYKYMHKGHTNASYRGKRLHGIGMAQACKECTNRGFKGLVSVVEAHNLNSLRSVYRLGYQDIGKVYVIMVVGKYFTYADRGSRKYGFKLKPFLPQSDHR